MQFSHFGFCKDKIKWDIMCYLASIRGASTWILLFSCSLVSHYPLFLVFILSWENLMLLALASYTSALRLLLAREWQSTFPKMSNYTFKCHYKTIKSIVTAQEQYKIGIYTNLFYQLSNVSSVDVKKGVFSLAVSQGCSYLYASCGAVKVYQSPSFSVNLTEEKLCCSVLLEHTTPGFPAFLSHASLLFCAAVLSACSSVHSLVPYLCDSVIIWKWMDRFLSSSDAFAFTLHVRLPCLQRGALGFKPLLAVFKLSVARHLRATWCFYFSSLTTYLA